MTTYTEPYRSNEIISSECEGTLSRESVTIVAGSGTIVAGTVLGQITNAGTATAAANAGNTGTGTVGTITVSAGAKPGAYKLTIIHAATDAGTFLLTDPIGLVVGSGTVAVAFSKGGLAFTLSDATDFVVGDGFTITVAAGSGKYAPYDDDNTNGTEVAACIALENVDATADVTCATLFRMAEYKADLLVWAGTNDAGDKTAGLADLAAKYLIGR